MIGQKIRAKRKACSMERKEFARAIRISEGSVSNLESGKYSVPSERLWHIAAVLGCHPEELLPPMPSTYNNFVDQLQKMDNATVGKWIEKGFVNLPPTS